MFRKLQRSILAGLFILGALAPALCATAADAQPPLAENGRLDLSAWDFSANGSVALDGQWEFHPRRLLTPSDFKTSAPPDRRYINVPGLWSHPFKHDAPYPAKGYATYRLLVSLKPDGRPKAVRMANFLSVCRVWINGRMVAQSGGVGTDRDAVIPRRHMLMAHVPANASLVEIVVELSNFHNVNGGLNTSVWLGDREQIELSTHRKLIITAILGGVLCFLGLYHLMLFAVRRRETTNLYFGLYTLAMAVSKLFHDADTHVMATLFPQMPWRWSIDFTLLPYGLSIPLIVMFYHAAFPRNRVRALETVYQVLGGLYIVYILATPPNAFDGVCIIYRTIALSVVPYLAFRLVMDLVRREKGIMLLLAGYLCLAATGVNDLVYDTGLFNDVMLIPYGLFVFILSYSMLISIRFSKAFNEIEQFSRNERLARIKFEATQRKVYLATLEKNRLELELGQRKQREAEALLAAEKARLEKLRYQMNPHFIYNTLTNIRGAIVSDTRHAREMVTDMATYFRLSLSRGNLDVISIEEELNLLSLYLGIERTRLGDFLNFSVDTSAVDAKTIMIPTFMLQPLVENAIKYGSATSPDRLDIGIEIKPVPPDHLTLKVTNSGAWVEKDGQKRRSTGIGLKNIEQRLENIYDGQSRLDTRCIDGKVEVTVLIPLS